MQYSRGLETKHEHAANLVARDTRTLGSRITEWLSYPLVSIFLYAAAGVLGILFSMYLDLILLAATVFFIFTRTRPTTLPFKLPKSSKIKDLNNLAPGSYQAQQAGGIAFFGNEKNTLQELWFSNEDLRTHVLIFGSTGSGKTESLVSIAFNSLIHGSGFIYVDGKGDNSLFAKIFSMVRQMGREDDLLLINFMTGARDVIGPQHNRLSNTMNPFANGSSSMLSQLVISLMDGASGDQSGDMWKGRAINFVESLMIILCTMRDAGHILLDANSIRNYFLLEKLESIVIDLKFPISNNLYIPIDNYPPKVLDPIKNYLFNLPGYNPKNKFNQAGEVREQHGFITMQLTRVFGSLADTYGHIIRTNLAEVDVKDVVLNRRILVVLLPALEKSPEELANLGKVIIASLKSMMASGLGDQVEGKFIDVISNKPTNSKSPFVCIMDEYGYYAVKGFAIVAAQARSLGFSAIFAGQDLPAFQKASKEEAASIGANCNIKICMKLEDPAETWDYFNKTAGETYVTNVSGFQLNPGNIALNYLDNRSASLDRRQRIDLLDLKDQREGEAHLFFKSKIVRGRMFFANPEPVTELRINQLLKVDNPEITLMLDIAQRINSFIYTFKNINQKIKIPPNEDIECIQLSLLHTPVEANPIERAITALVSLLEIQAANHLTIDKHYELIAQNKKISIFHSITKPSVYTINLLGNQIKAFCQPIIKASNVLEIIKEIECLSNQNIQLAQNNAKKLLKDLENASTFPITLPSYKKSNTETDCDFLRSLNDILMLFNLDPVSYDSEKSKILEDSLPELPDLE